MPTYTLTDAEADIRLDEIDLGPADIGQADGQGPAWSVRKRTLRGGRRDWVDLIAIDNGDLGLSVVPTRGMGIWRGYYRDDRLGWDSPIRDGPVHPRLVDLASLGGLGWLEGFDELLVRCGTRSNGPPTVEGPFALNLHGRIANIPAHRVTVAVEPGPPGTIVVEGEVDEAHFLGPQIRMTTRLTTVIGSNRVTIRDEFTNRADTPGELSMLYHWNFGPPYLGAGSRFHAPIAELSPRDPRSADGIDHFADYDGPTPGFAEQAYYCKLIGDGPDGRTLAMLRDPSGQRAIVLRFATAQLPTFTLWKNTAGLRDGYVTGLEPATNYPNPKPFERQQGRIIPLAPGQSHVAETTLEVLDTLDAVATAEAEVAELQARARPTIHRRPTEPFAPRA